MLTISAVVKTSDVCIGLGLFAREDIPAGTVIWRFTPGFDVCFDSPQQLAAMGLSDVQIADINYFSYPDWLVGGWVYCCDGTKYMNHSDTPNIGYLLDGTTIALCDILQGTELLTNYREIGLSTDF